MGDERSGYLFITWLNGIVEKQSRIVEITEGEREGGVDLGGDYRGGFPVKACVQRDGCVGGGVVVVVRMMHVVAKSENVANCMLIKNNDFLP